ncbi:MAG: magnesium transporter [Chromatiales bacterium]|nr:magnesium transporter [Chromatiales bacterium]
MKLHAGKFAEIRRLVAEGTLDTGDPDLRDFIQEQHPADIGAFLSDLTQEAAWQLLGLLPLPVRAAVFGYLSPTAQAEIARKTRRGELADIVSEMNADERADLFNKLDQRQQQALLPALSQAEREDIRRLAGHEENTAGAIMTSEYATLRPGLTVRQAFERLRLQAPDKETIYRAYVVDDHRHLLGSVRLQELILADPEQPVEDLMDRNTLAVQVTDSNEYVARMIRRYDVLALPVVDADHRIVGIVTHDDALDVLERAATEDFQKVGTVVPMEESLRDAGIGLLYRKRIPWLVVLVFGNLLSGAGIAYYEDTIASYVALVFFLPLLIASGGNAGSQSATLMVRSLATGDVVLRDWSRMLGREVLIAVLLGLTMALAISGIGLYRGGLEIAQVVALTMVLVVMIGSTIGMSLPFLLSRVGLDPATASAPLITSIADAAGVFIYFAIATAVLFPVAGPGG